MLRKIQSHLFTSVSFRCLKTMGTEAMCRSQGLWWVRQFALTFFLLSLSHPGLALLAKILWSLPQMGRQDINRIRNIPVRHSWILESRKMIVFWHKTWIHRFRYCNMTVCNQWLGRPKFPGSLFDHPSQKRCRQDLEGAYLISFEYHLIRPASTSDDRQVGNMLFACSGPPADTANFVWELRHFPYSRSWLSLWDFAFCLLQMEFIEKNVKLNELRTGIPMTTKAEKVRSCLRWKVRHSCHPQFYSWKCAKHWAFQNFRTI